MYQTTKLYSYTRRIYIRFSVLRVARSSNGTPVTLFYTSQESVSRYSLRISTRNQDTEISTCRSDHHRRRIIQAPHRHHPTGSRGTPHLRPEICRSVSTSVPTSFVPGDTCHVLFRGTGPPARSNV